MLKNILFFVLSFMLLFIYGCEDRSTLPSQEKIVEEITSQKPMKEIKKEKAIVEKSLKEEVNASTDIKTIEENPADVEKEEKITSKPATNGKSILENAISPIKPIEPMNSETKKSIDQTLNSIKNTLEDVNKVNAQY